MRDGIRANTRPFVPKVEDTGNPWVDPANRASEPIAEAGLLEHHRRKIPAPKSPQTRGAMKMDNERIVREFIEAWSRLDPEELSRYFTEDGVYHNMPTEPVKGRKNVQKMIAGFIESWTETEWEVLHLLSAGDVVIAERVDRTKAGDKAVDLPCTGVFEMEKGKIKVWRDYFDLTTYVKGMT
jgi:limonene-1,2-epoxide hydrolase